jgi:hypothetical protein
MQVLTQSFLDTPQPPKRRQKLPPWRVKIKQRQQQALELRKGGATYLEIGAALGVTKQRAYSVVMAAVDDLNGILKETAVTIRAIELERLDSMQMGLWPQRKNPRVVDTLLRIAERRARLLGLDAPVRTALTDADGGPVVFALKSILDEGPILQAATPCLPARESNADR